MSTAGVDYGTISRWISCAHRKASKQYKKETEADPGYISPYTAEGCIAGLALEHLVHGVAVYLKKPIRHQVVPTAVTREIRTRLRQRDRTRGEGFTSRIQGCQNTIDDACGEGVLNIRNFIGCHTNAKVNEAKASEERHIEEYIKHPERFTGNPIDRFEVCLVAAMHQFFEGPSSFVSDEVFDDWWGKEKKTTGCVLQFASLVRHVARFLRGLKHNPINPIDLFETCLTGADPRAGYGDHDLGGVLDHLFLSPERIYEELYNTCQWAFQRSLGFPAKPLILQSEHFPELWTRPASENHRSLLLHSTSKPPCSSAWPSRDRPPIWVDVLQRVGCSEPMVSFLCESLRIHELEQLLTKADFIEQELKTNFGETSVDEFRHLVESLNSPSGVWYQ